MPAAVKRILKKHPPQAVCFPLPSSDTLTRIDCNTSDQYPRDQQNLIRLAIPRRGHVLSTASETFAKPIREAVAFLANSLSEKRCADIHRELFCPLHAWPDSGVRTAVERTAWTVVSIWVTAIATRSLPPTASLENAEFWFFGSRSAQLTNLPSAKAVRDAEASLRAAASAAGYLELLPYILDPHGPGSRLSIRRDPGTQVARTRKRAEGVFYTPADVAEYMADACIEGLVSKKSTTIFDPACGTGVFLRAAFKTLRRNSPNRDPFSLATECLFGADIDPWPLDATAFVLLADIWPVFKTPPAAAWRRLRQNLACIDTLRLDRSEGETYEQPNVPPRNPKARLKLGHEDTHFRLPISRLFPALADGPTVILGNPPYAALGKRDDLSALGQTLETIAVKAQSSAEIYPAFIEQVIRLASQESCAGALVLPLSIAYHLGSQFNTARRLIGQTRGKWRFAFFDREPHALFGEDVKTRNAIFLWSRTASDTKTTIATGPLRKWRGDNRAVMFKDLRFTPVNMDIRLGIPKIEGRYQTAALDVLKARWERLEQAVEDIGRENLSVITGSDAKTVFVGPTAYNFLNVFLKPHQGVLNGSKALSEHPLHAVRCASAKDAQAVFAILSSHFAYWWWHAHSDGFHVSRRLIAELPIGVNALAGTGADDLAKCGEELWTAIKSRPIISLNAGRTSLAFTPNGHDSIRRKADVVLARSVGLSGDFVDELQKFTARSVAATLHETT